MAKELSENKETPNINFLEFQQELFGVADDIKSSLKKTGLKKLFGGNKDNPQVDGNVIGEHAPESKEVAKFVSDLRKDASNSVVRAQLVNAVANYSKDHKLSTMKSLMMQAAVPVYLGDISPPLLQICIVMYRAYLEKLQNVHKQNMMSIRSSVLKNVNMSGVDVSDEGKDDANVKNTEAMMMEIRVSEALMERCEEALNVVKTRLQVTLSREEIEEITAEGKAAAAFFGGGGGANDEKAATQKQNMIIGKSVQVIEAIKQVPLLQGAGLQMAQQLGRVDNKLSYPLVMEGRLYMQMMRYFLLRLENGDRKSRDNMAPTYNKAVVAYRKAMKLVSKTNPKKADLPVLTEFANVTHYGFIHRDLMRFTKDGVKGLVKLGKDAVDAAVMVDESFKPLQGRLESSLNQLDKAGASSS